MTARMTFLLMTFLIGACTTQGAREDAQGSSRVRNAGVEPQAQIELDVVARCQANGIDPSNPEEHSAEFTRLISEAKQLGVEPGDGGTSRAVKPDQTVPWADWPALPRILELQGRPKGDTAQVYLLPEIIERLRAVAPEVLRADDTKPGGVSVDVALAKRMGEDRLTVARALLEKLEGCLNALKAREEYLVKKRNAEIQRRAQEVPSGRTK